MNCPIECLKETVQAPVRTINAALVIDDSDGKLQPYQGFRVQHNRVRGPLKGDLHTRKIFFEQKMEQWEIDTGLTSAVLEWKYAYLPMSPRIVRGDIS
ncbi:MAG: hypothetical protein KAJ73_04625 [Zetaproteobacteria bacterium]|nr:hypothetical protein [Zetaproteobacteria bacterium]